MQVFLDAYSWGAGVASELANTAPEVWHGVDKLPDLATLAAFLAEHEIRPGGESGPGDATSADLAAVRLLRDEVRAVIDSTEEEFVVARAAELVARAGGGLTLERDAKGQWQWSARSVAGVDLADEIALVVGVGLLGVLRTLGIGRFRPCAAPTCSGVFVDASRSGRRRYCMPDLCGNRINVANHRARQRAAPAPRPSRNRQNS